MKRRTLSELLCDDYEALANPLSKTVLSEEAIRYMLAFFEEQGKLSHPIFVHINNLEKLLTNELKLETLPEGMHFQFMVEVGYRSKEAQRAANNVHYCAIDLFTLQEGTPLMILADHYVGHAAFDGHFKSIAKKLNVHFLVLGFGQSTPLIASNFQADTVHCPIFTMNHLLLSANYSHDFHKHMEQLAVSLGTEECTFIDWFFLPPEFIIPAQSTKIIYGYLDHVSKTEHLSEGKSSVCLAKSAFPSMLSSALRINAQQKVINHAIEDIASHLAGQAVVSLESPQAVKETDLIALCYAEQYPLTYQLLMTAHKEAQMISELEQRATPEAHPLFELCFSNTLSLEALLSENTFHHIFSNKDLLFFMQQGALNPDELYNYLRIVENGSKINKLHCNIVKSNLQGLAKLKAHLDKTKQTLPMDLLKLIKTQKLKSFFEHPILSSLLSKGILSMEHFTKISTHLINHDYFNTLSTDDARFAYLDQHFELNETDSSETASSSSSSGEESIFEFDLYNEPENSFDEENAPRDSALSKGSFFAPNQPNSNHHSHSLDSNELREKLTALSG